MRVCISETPSFDSISNPFFGAFSETIFTYLIPASFKYSEYEYLGYVTKFPKKVKNLFFTNLCIEKIIELESNEQIKTLESSTLILKKFSDLNVNSKSVIRLIN